MLSLKETYNKIAKDWVKDHQDDSWWIEGTDTFVTFLPKEGAVLDVGCGAGDKSIYLTERGLKVTGCDFSEGMIEIAKKRAPDIPFLVKDIKEPLGLSSRFDGVFAQAVLLHIPKKEVSIVLKNITEPLKTGGHLYVAVKEVKAHGIEEEVRKEDDYGYEYERFFSYFRLPELKQYIEALGLKVVYESADLSGKTTWLQVIAQKV